MAAAAADLLDLRTLLSACVHVARRGGRIIREVHRDGQLQAHNKKVQGDESAPQAMEPSEVLTIADTRAQDAIVSSLRSMFPGLRLVGEEDEDAPTGIARATPTRLEEVPLLDAPFEVPAALAASLTLADTCLWVDPLDGTIEFVRGNVHHVCVLLGITVKDRPVAGVVLEPFLGPEGDGIVTYGAVGVGVFGDRAPPFGTPPGDLVVGLQASGLKNARVQSALSRLGAPEPLVSQGAGQNLLKVLRGEVSVYLTPPGASRWDTCPGEALLMALGGRLTGLDGQPYLYEQGAESYGNSRGCIAALSPEVHDQVTHAWAQGEAA